MLTVTEAAKVLNVSKRTVWRLLASGALSRVRAGDRATRINPEHLAAFIAAGGKAA